MSGPYVRCIDSGLYLFNKVLSSCWRIIHLLPFWRQRSTPTARHILDKDILEQINIQETLGEDLAHWAVLPSYSQLFL